MSLDEHPPVAGLRELIEAVQRHHLSSADLPSYLAGLNADGQMMELAHQLAPQNLSSKALLTRLRAMEHEA